MHQAPQQYSGITDLYFRPAGLCRVYDISIRFSKEQEQQSIRFNQEIKCLEQDAEGAYLFEIKRDQAVLDERKASENPATALAEDCGSVLYPLLLKVTREGRVTGLHNYETILKRWQELKPRLETYYTGPIAEEYIGQTDATINNSKKIKEIIRQDLFLNTFFAPLYNRYMEFQPVRCTVPYPALPFHQPLLFDIDQQVKEKRDSGIYIEQEGKLSGVQPAVPLYSEDEGVKATSGNMRARYYMTAPHHYIETAECHWEVLNGSTSGITIRLDCIDDYSKPVHQ